MTVLSPQTVTTCKPWCNDHVLYDPNIGGPDPEGGWCRYTRDSLVVEDTPDGRVVVGTAVEAAPPLLMDDVELSAAERLAAELRAFADDITRAVADVRAALRSAA